ncbi:hypothetical protein BST16_09250 [Mycobacterium asiaticum DSM 44297]|nr:hypothetical protein BST16_09250 [Mycobacterium asiaticum DSM 44297]
MISDLVGHTEDRVAVTVEVAGAALLAQPSGVCHSFTGCGWPIQPRSALIAGDAQQRTGQR